MWDLNDYYKWLTDQQKQDKKEAQGDVDSTPSINSANARKEQKRLEAELRKQTAPIRKKLTQLETKMDKLGTELADAEQLLSDVSLYQDENKAKLTEVLTIQASRKSQLEDVEMEWMALQEELESLNQ